MTADPDPGSPSIAAWKDLLTGLRRAKRYAALPEGQPHPRPDLQSVSRMVVALHSFLKTSQEVTADQLEEPLERLAAALGDLGQGRRPKLFEPIPRHRPKGIAEQTVMAVAALALDEMVVGLGTPVEEGARKVARNIAAAKLEIKARGDAALFRTVTGYRERLMVGEGSAPPVALQLWNDYRRDPSPFGQSSAERVRTLLRILRTGSRLHWR